jgi:hypothetical protein
MFNHLYEVDHTQHVTCELVVGFAHGKGRAVPVHDWTGPEDSRRLRLPHFKTIGT